MFFYILVEGSSDVPGVREILKRCFGLKEKRDFHIHPHQGKGRLPEDFFAKPNRKHRGLLSQLPAKLRAFGSWKRACVVVLLDADNDDCGELKQSLVSMYRSLDQKPACVLFRIAVEELESWWIADPQAVKAAYPSADVSRIEEIPPDSVVGAWEELAIAVGRTPERSRREKKTWARRIAPHVALKPPKSPSLRAFVEGMARLIREYRRKPFSKKFP